MHFKYYRNYDFVKKWHANFAMYVYVSTDYVKTVKMLD